MNVNLKKFLEVERKSKADLRTVLQNSTLTAQEIRDVETIYVQDVLAAAGTLGIELNNVSFESYLVSQASNGRFQDLLTLLRFEVRKLEMQNELLGEVEEEVKLITYVGLQASDKEKIREYIARLKECVDASDAHVSKKERVYRILAELGKEVDLDRTPMTRLADVVRGISEISNDAASAVEPWWKYVSKISRVFDRRIEAEAIEHHKVGQIEDLREED